MSREHKGHPLKSSSSARVSTTQKKPHFSKSLSFWKAVGSRPTPLELCTCSHAFNYWISLEPSPRSYFQVSTDHGTLGHTNHAQDTLMGLPSLATSARTRAHTCMHTHGSSKRPACYSHWKIIFKFASCFGQSIKIANKEINSTLAASNG